MKCDEIKAWPTPQVEWKENAIIKKSIFFCFVSTSLFYGALLIKKPFIGIQGSKYDGKALKKALEYITQK